MVCLCAGHMFPGILGGKGLRLSSSDKKFVSLPLPPCHRKPSSPRHSLSPPTTGRWSGGKGASYAARLSHETRQHLPSQSHLYVGHTLAASSGETGLLPC